MAIMVNTVIDNLHSQFRKTPDPCDIGNARFRFDDIGTAASSAILMQSPSFPDQLCETWHKAHEVSSGRHRLFVTMDILNNYALFDSCHHRPF